MKDGAEQAAPGAYTQEPTDLRLDSSPPLIAYVSLEAQRLSSMFPHLETRPYHACLTGLHESGNKYKIGTQ